MYLRHLQLGDFRNWERVDLALRPGPTVFVGRNGEGKTNLVEAVSYLATLGSHRVATDAPLVRHGAGQGVIRAAVRRGDRELLVELEINPGRANRVRLNRSPLSRPRELLGLVRTVLFARFVSRQDDSPTMKAVAALRNQFGGHAVRAVAAQEAERPA